MMLCSVVPVSVYETYSKCFFYYEKLHSSTDIDVRTYVLFYSNTAYNILYFAWYYMRNQSRIIFKFVGLLFLPNSLGIRLTCDLVYER